MTVEIQPLPRGSGFVFSQRVVGGAVPKQWIPAVEQGVRDGLEKGPLGFPVTDLEVTLIDGQTHSVDSLRNGLPHGRAPGHGGGPAGLRRGPAGADREADGLFALAQRLERHLGADRAGAARSWASAPREDWRGWERIEAYLPQSERQGLIAELRGLTQGLGAFEADFDHMAELTGRLATEASQGAAAARPHA